jgi:ribonuclease P protein component
MKQRSRSSRLSSADFRTFRPARRISGDFFTLSIAPEGAGPKWACVVSKKVSVKAPVRNLIKRRMRSILRIALGDFHEPLALVFQAKRGAEKATFAQMRGDLAKLLGRAGLQGTMLSQ